MLTLGISMQLQWGPIIHDDQYQGAIFANLLLFLFPHLKVVLKRVFTAN